ncbi:TetR/AcrR family transcriptional regulator [Fulvivirga sp. 29W222]|uniref:TetR/AcrR family transcriptional regulator n=1 Tax=Fulvivirga marina TaxID=2494733 RepID=A0A937FZY0_9BACT|nr:TetR family transcriptional regulator C-terminal domain-containing protein [Fulvivirga marina]MBL6449245.1 TetR/AcrR family transcriptional regulator [Fulvivirga marina]
MEQTKKRSPKAKVNPSSKITEAYREYVLLNGSQPPSVFQFMKNLKMKEDVFYEYYGSFENLEKEIWSGYITETTSILHNDDNYAAYSSREKLLAFYYTLIEVLKKDRSYVSYSFKNVKRPELTPSFLKEFKTDFIDFVQGILNEGLDTEEIIKRPLISDRYKDGLWLQLMFVLNFWLKDESKGFINTDAAIEKSVHLSFELMGRGPLDTMVDFAKFLYNNR